MTVSEGSVRKRFTLTEDALHVLDGVSERDRSRFVSEAIVYFNSRNSDKSVGSSVLEDVGNSLGLGAETERSEEEFEREEAERIEQERIEAERLRIEAERLEALRIERERLEAEQEAERIYQERIGAERIAAVKWEQDHPVLAFFGRHWDEFVGVGYVLGIFVGFPLGFYLLFAYVLPFLLPGTGL